MNIRVGFFGRPHGLRGEMTLNIFSETGWKPAHGAVIECVDKQNDRITLKILDIRAHNHRCLLTCSGIADRSSAERIAGCEIRADIPALPDDAFLVEDLIGSSVKTTDGRYIGTIAQVFSTGVNDIYSVVHEGREVLIPALKNIVNNFNKETKELLVTLPDGLEESSTWSPKPD